MHLSEVWVERYYSLCSSSIGIAVMLRKLLNGRRVTLHGPIKPAFSSSRCTHTVQPPHLHLVLSASFWSLSGRGATKDIRIPNGRPPLSQTLIAHREALSSQSVASLPPADVTPRAAARSDWLDRDGIYSAPRLILSSHG